MARLAIQRASDTLIAGGVLAYPTEGVYGLGCLPDDAAAVERILTIKRRGADAGLILIAPVFELLEPWLAPSAAELRQLQTQFDYPVTWVVTAIPTAPDWLTGGRPTLAVRVSKHPVVTAICEEVGSALVSTSANRRGRPPALTTLQARKTLGSEVDLVVPGAVGTARSPSEIRAAKDNRVIRPFAAPANARIL
ncbi:MAG: L-threonylcarbamoyladenylate synthase [Gammaproteobacteria bacterium]